MTTSTSASGRGGHNDGGKEKSRPPFWSRITPAMVQRTALFFAPLAGVVAGIFLAHLMVGIDWTDRLPHAPFAIGTLALILGTFVAGLMRADPLQQMYIGEWKAVMLTFMECGAIAFGVGLIVMGWFVH
jgi:hypothetical protein